MFAYIKGVLAQAAQAFVVIEAGGIGYKIFIPASAFSRLSHLGSEMTLQTSFIVREQAQTLYGFITANERDFFEALMGVTGIGPKIALALIGHMPLYELQQAIGQGDIATLCRVPGIGKKGAERLIIEMRDKVATLSPSDLSVHSCADLRSQTDRKSTRLNSSHAKLYLVCRLLLE